MLLLLSFAFFSVVACGIVWWRYMSAYKQNQHMKIKEYRNNEKNKEDAIHEPLTCVSERQLQKRRTSCESCDTSEVIDGFHQDDLLVEDIDNILSNMKSKDVSILLPVMEESDDENSILNQGSNENQYFSI